MVALRRPTTETIRAFLDAKSSAALTYADVGATSGRLPAGYRLNHTRVRLGEGESVFFAASAALRGWKQLELGWVEAWPSSEEPTPGVVVAIAARTFGLWWLNACRVVYVVNEPGPFRRYGYAYGTLPGHAGSGEERFLVEHDPADGSVWYDILAFSRPQVLLTRLGYPWMRRLQRRFGRESAGAMRHV